MKKSNYIYLSILTLISSVILLVLGLITQDSIFQLSISFVLINILILISSIKVTTW